VSPEDAISSLDRMLAANGQDIQLVRVTGAANQAKFAATVRAFVRGYKPNEIVGSIVQGDSMVTISATDIERANWPGPQVVKSPPVTADIRVPTTNDKAVIAGKTRNIAAAVPFYLDGQLVRIELSVKG